MTERKTFDLLTNPLEGINLIEASAGTGKTFTIAGLFLRLILEKNFSVNEILVVTFTVAATAELKDRIRNRLKEAIEAFSRGKSSDEFLNSLIKNFSDPKPCLKRLKDALRDFDEAAIFTIHGFCQRVLKEHAFESGLLFDTELITEEEALRQEIVDDFWRLHFYNASPLFVHYAFQNNCTPDNFLKLARLYSDKPRLKVIPEITGADTTLEETEFIEAVRSASASWASSRPEIEKIFSLPGFKKPSVAKVPELMIGLDYFFSSGGTNLTFLNNAEIFTHRGVINATKKNNAPPEHPFFVLFERLKKTQEALSRAYNQRLMAIKTSLLYFLQERLARQKQKMNVQSFHDLLLNVRNALTDTTSGGELAAVIQGQYHAALIDEFQDTDPLQYEIFHAIFKNRGGILFLIGDPKQAIYSFRGADIFAYLGAISQVETHYTLKENWRSDPPLINAINTVFSQVKDPFVFEAITFQKAAPAKDKQADPLIIDGQAESPLQLWFTDTDNLTSNQLTKKGFIKKPEARDLILQAVAGKIVTLLLQGKENRAFIRQRPIKEQDIAVLVRTNSEAVAMQQVLSARNVPSVLYTTGNLFDSREAYELLRILEAIAEPYNEKLIKAALTTDILGLSGEEIEGALEDEAVWITYVNAFLDYHAAWHTRNFFSMFRSLLLKEKIRLRLLSFADGERRLTNVLHLAEVLHNREHQEQLTIEGLLKWLAGQINPDVPRLEEHQLRLETDEHAVKIVTIHKSKGLEYPVIFCPFLWDTSKLRKANEPFLFHENGELMLDLGSEGRNENRAIAEKEMLSENLRLLYVALTRARNCCYTVWGRFNEAGSSGMSYLFHSKERDDEKISVNVLETAFNDVTNDRIKEVLKNLEAESNGDISALEIPDLPPVTYVPPGEAAEALSLKVFSGHIDRTWKISSFSSLTAGKQLHPDPRVFSFLELPDYDQETQPRQTPGEEPAGIFAFPRGAKAGSFMHDLLEHLDFMEKDGDLIKTVITENLRLYGFDVTWQETIFDMIKNVLAVSLLPDRKDFTLSAIPQRDKISELEFYFPLQPLSSEKLKSIFLKYGGDTIPQDFPEQIENLQFAPAQGFMRGFIDLFFCFHDSYYLIDWKSNFLGTTIEEYSQEKLDAVMADEYYHLQYLLYTVAMDKYLSNHVRGYSYEKHFGGVFYLFLRGIDPRKGPAFGIYHNRPSAKLIRELSQTLITFS